MTSITVLTRANACFACILISLTMLSGVFVNGDPLSESNLTEGIKTNPSGRSGDAPGRDPARPGIRDNHSNTLTMGLRSAVSFMDERHYHFFSESMDEDDPIYAGHNWIRTSNHPSGYWLFSRAYLDVEYPFGDTPVKVLDATLSMTTEHWPDEEYGLFYKYDNRNITLTVPLTVHRMLEYWDSEIIGSCDQRTSLPRHNATTAPPVLEKDHRNVTVSWDVTTMFDYWSKYGNRFGLAIKGPEDRENGYDDQPHQSEFLEGNEPGSGYRGAAFGTNYFHGLDSGNHSPTIVINYLTNTPPRGEITNPAHNNTKEGMSLSFTGSTVDPDGDDITICEWVSDRDGPLAVGQGKTEVSITNLSVGLHRISFRVRDGFEEMPMWSEPAWQTVRILPNNPEIVDVKMSSKGSSEECNELLLGSEVVIHVSVQDGIPPYRGKINISYWDPHIPVVTMDELDSDMSYTWNTKGSLPGKYRLDVTVMDVKGKKDDDGLFGPEADAILLLVDDEPPEIERVEMSQDGKVRGSFVLGTSIMISVYEANDEDGLTGHLDIIDPDDNLIFGSLPLQPADRAGTYSYQWNTRNVAMLGTYKVESRLVDQSGNWDSTTTEITLTDENPPSVFSVVAMLGSQSGESFPVATSITIMMDEENREDGLNARVSINLDDTYILYDTPMNDMEDGRYYITWDTRDLEPGWYSVNITLSDDEGNMDPDGLGKKDVYGNPLPDLWIRLTVPPAILVVSKTFPASEAVLVSPATMIAVHFSQEVDPSSVNGDTVSVRMIDGPDIEFGLDVDRTGTFCLIDPVGNLPEEALMAVELREDITSPEGVPLTPYEFQFLTGLLETSATADFVPWSNHVFIDPGETAVFQAIVPSDGEWDTVWSVDGVRAEESGNATYTFMGDINDTGRHEVNVLVLGEDESFEYQWTVVVRPSSGDGSGDPTGLDEDGDGLPDQWEQQHFGDLDQGPSDDPDGDGRNNLEELEGGSDPGESSESGGGRAVIAVMGGMIALLLVINLLLLLKRRRRFPGGGSAPVEPAAAKGGIHRNLQDGDRREVGSTAAAGTGGAGPGQGGTVTVRKGVK